MELLLASLNCGNGEVSSLLDQHECPDVFQRIEVLVDEVPDLSQKAFVSWLRLTEYYQQVFPNLLRVYAFGVAREIQDLEVVEAELEAHVI